MVRAEHRPLTDAEEAALVLPVERAFLGAYFQEPSQRLSPLTVDDFLDARHRLIWGACLRLVEGGEPPTLTGVATDLSTHSELSAAGGPAHLALCFEEGHIPAYVPGLARSIRAFSRDRYLRELGETLRAEGLDAEEIMARLQEAPGAETGLFDHRETWRQVEAAWKEERFLTGFTEVDHLTTGLAPGDFIIVGGRTSHGKTAWLCEMARRFVERGVGVDYITLEESEAAIVRRFMAGWTGLSTRRLKDGSITEEEYVEIEQAQRRWDGLPLRVQGIEQIRTLEENAVVAAVGRAAGPVVILDHLQQVTTRDQSRVYGLERVLKRLQAAALRERKVLFLAAQLNRETETRQGPPRLSDLRDCGAIEQAGRLIFLVYYPCKHDAKRGQEEYEVYLAKHADGGTGLIPLRFEPWCGRFQDGAWA